MNCPHCKATLSDDARFCSSCGRTTTGGDQDNSYETYAAETRRAMTAKRKAATEPDQLVGRVLEGKYEIVARLGAGGMGAVYRARRLRIGDEVAIKVISPEYVAEPEAIERFRREARAAALLHHPNVVTIHDYSESSDEDFPAYIVMELVAGGSLRDLMDREGRLAYGRAIALMRDICAGVGAAHKHGIIHRDLKPDNILIVPPHDITERETVKVVDFGIAKLRDITPTGNLTLIGEVIGTPYYMSPEQCKGLHLDPRSDVYSLGAIMYEMIAGIHPFYSQSATAIVAKHLMEPVPPLPPQLGIPPMLEMVIRRALAKNADSRPIEAVSFSRELQAAVDQRGTGRLVMTGDGSKTGTFSGNGSQVIAGRKSSGLRVALVTLLALLLLGVAVAGFIIIRNSQESNSSASSSNQNSPRNTRGGQTNTRDSNKNANNSQANINGPNQPGRIDVTGKWNSLFGLVELRQIGPSVSGSIKYLDGSGFGTITGTINGRSLTFDWIDNTTRSVNGRGQVELSADGQIMIGSMRMSTGDTSPLLLQRAGQ